MTRQNSASGNRNFRWEGCNDDSVDSGRGKGKETVRLQLSASIGGVITQPGETVEQVIGHLEEQADVAAYIKTLDFPVDIVSCEYHTAYSNPDLVNQLHAMGIQAAFWTVDTQDAVRSLLPLGPDCIVTNRPDRVREWVNAEMRK